MKNEIFHKEKIEISKTVKQWIASIVLLVDILILTLLWHNYLQGTLFSKDFDKNSLIAVTVVIIFFTFLILISILYLSGYILIIEENGMILKGKTGKAINIAVDQIDFYKKLSKKEVRKYMNETRNSRHRKKGKIRQFLISAPNYLINLKNGEKILLQSKRPASFEYSMNKILNLNG